MRGLSLGLLAALLASGGLHADDDLAVIKRAVSADSKTPGALGKDETAAARKGEPQWLRVRVTGKNDNKKRVSVNLPLAFVKAVGSDWPLHLGSACRREHQAHYCSIKLSEVLKTLESGQDIVQVDDEEESIRVWVE